MSVRRLKLVFAHVCVAQLPVEGVAQLPVEGVAFLCRFL